MVGLLSRVLRPGSLPTVYAVVHSAALRGIESHPLLVEVGIAPGLPSFSLVGLPGGAVRESRERVLSALARLGTPLPPRRVTVNLAPADVPKGGSGLDLPLAIGLLSAMGRLPPDRVRRWGFAGELGLDGALRPIPGVLSLALAIREAGLEGIVVPLVNAGEAALVEGLRVFGARSLEEAVQGLLEGDAQTPGPPRPGSSEGAGPFEDLSDVRGHAGAKRALEITAAGGHNLLLVGPPGCGKTMLARRIPGILPPMTPREMLEVTRIHSVAGTLARGVARMEHRPFRAPHHTVSDAGLAGGGSGPRPGEATLAHHGVLFLDELPEIRRSVLEVLRQPLEEGEITIARSKQVVRFPAAFILVAAMNPCPCGWQGDPADRCRCEPGHVSWYRGRVSGPLADRIDLHYEILPVDPDHLLSPGSPGESSAQVRERVTAAREIQELRQQVPNAALTPRDLDRFARPDPAGRGLLRDALTRLGLSARGVHRVRKVARTIADLAGRAEVSASDVAEAIRFRGSEPRP